MVVGASPKTALDVVKGKDLSGKTAVVTGGNSGIGLETVRSLAFAGADVYYTCRTLEKGKRVHDSVFNDVNLSGKVHLLHLNLEDLASVKQVAKELDKLQKIDFLILNAGIMACPYTVTKHGFEKQFGINVIGHYYLEQLLEKKLASQGALETGPILSLKGLTLTLGIMFLIQVPLQSTPTRVIILSSVAHQFGWIDLNDLHYKHGRSYWAWPAYGQTKMADLLWAKELARRLSGSKVSVCSVHPGNIFTDLQKYLYFGKIIFWFFSLFGITKSPQQGAATTVWATVAPEIEQNSGAYLEDCKISKPSKPGEDAKLAHDLCNVIEQQLYTALKEANIE